MSTAQIARDTIPVDVDDDDQPEARILDHAYDGIQEFDNPLPAWWRWIFIGTIVFAGFYGLYFHVVGWGSTPAERYSKALAAYDDNKEIRQRAELANINEDYLAQQVRDDKVVARGAAIFKERCASCHGAQATGLIGPNLTDDRQIHGDSRLDIYKTVRGGAPGTAMLAWGEQMAPGDVVAAAAFVITLRNKSLPGKAPEGQLVKPFTP